MPVTRIPPGPGRAERTVFALGDAYAGGASSLIAVLHLVFLTDIVGLNPALAGTAALLAKLWDAINDPLTGALSDRTRTRFGRRRPWIIGGGLLLIGGMTLLWWPQPPVRDQLALAAWAMGTYIVYNTIQTTIAVPYASLSTELSTDPAIRNRINVLRLLCSTVASASLTLIATQLVTLYREGSLSARGLQLALVGGFGSVFTILVLLVGICCRERVPLPPRPTRLRFFSGFAAPLKVPAFRVLLGMYLAQAIAMDIISATLLYYSANVVRGINPTVFLGTFIAINLIAFPIVGQLVKRVSKHTIYRTLLPVALVAIWVVALYPRGGSPLGVYAAAALLAIGMSGAQLLSWVIFPDVLDAAELATGRRDAGSFGGLMTFTRGVAAAITIQLIGLMLYLTGYRVPVAGQLPPQQPESAIWGIRLVLLVGVFTLLSVAWFISRRYPLTLDRTREIAAELDRRRGATVTDTLEQR
ncbi:hypothetical protein CGZ94_00665 [Enemella evansiae]|uniref:MFS transporter n=1 Tax=Enemella evansiae TaxID=2016499 RepID=A0A255GS70_9ACTN|nr:hypothetical protein CGZ94_00665 [Enemella evansiae]